MGCSSFFILHFNVQSTARGNLRMMCCSNPTTEQTAATDMLSKSIQLSANLSYKWYCRAVDEDILNANTSIQFQNPSTLHNVEDHPS